MWLESLKWMQMACLTIALLFLMKLPYTVQHLLDAYLDEESKRTAGANLRIQLSSDGMYEYIGLASYSTLLLGTMIAACCFDWFQTFQMTPEINETEAKIGVFVAMFSLVLHLCAHISLGKAWSGFVSLQKNHQLVTSGMYRFARHPMYSCMLLHGLSVFMISQNWFVGSVVIIPALFGMYRFAKEETLMVELFGQQYIDYHNRVGALWPWKVCGMDLGLTKYQMDRILAERDKQD